MDKTEALQLIADTRAKIVKLQEEKAAGGMPLVDEDEIRTALIELSQVADPTVPNPA